MFSAIVGLVLCLAGSAATEDVDRESLSQKATRQYPRISWEPKVVLVDVADGFTNRADKVVVWPAIQFHTEQAVMQAHLTEDAAFEKEMNVLVNGSQRDGRDTLFDARVHFPWAGMPGHALQHLEEDLTLVGTVMPCTAHRSRNSCVLRRFTMI
jgi:hypothetical protein